MINILHINKLDGLHRHFSFTFFFKRKGKSSFLHTGLIVQHQITYSPIQKLSTTTFDVNLPMLWNVVKMKLRIFMKWRLFLARNAVYGNFLSLYINLH